MFKYSVGDIITQIFQYSNIQLGSAAFEHGRGARACPVHNDWLQARHQGHQHIRHMLKHHQILFGLWRWKCYNSLSLSSHQIVKMKMLHFTFTFFTLDCEDENDTFHFHFLHIRLWRWKCYISLSLSSHQIVKMKMLHFTFTFFTLDCKDENVTFHFHFFTSDCKDENYTFYFYFLYIRLWG